jgi:hypothetical protein
VQDDQCLTTQEAVAHHRAIYEEGRLALWVITHGTTAYPSGYVARLKSVGPADAKNHPLIMKADTLETLRAMLPPGLNDGARYPEDDAVIVERWL